MANSLLLSQIGQSVTSEFSRAVVPSKSLLGFRPSERRAIIASGDQLIHRVFTFERFIDVLRASELVLVKPRLWPDPYENPLDRPWRDAKSGRGLHVPVFADSLYAQCWSLLPESDALWRIYSPGKRGVLATASAAALLAGPFEVPQLQRLYLGKVRYRSQGWIDRHCASLALTRRLLQASTRSPAAAITLLYKRDAFAHESEVRLIYHNDVSHDQSDLTRLRFDAATAIRSVTLDPRLTPDEFNRQAFLLRAAGYSGVLQQSNLYGSPGFTPSSVLPI